MDVGLVVQGPTTFCKQIAPCYSDFKYKVWSTWKTEPEEHIEFIKECGYEVILLDMPEQRGYWNINLQCKTVFEGIKFLKTRYEHLQKVIKIRSDMVIRPYEELIRSIDQIEDKIFFIGMSRLRVKPFKFDYYFLDYVVGGSIEEMLVFWQPEYSEESGLPYPEKWLENRYYKGNIHNDANEFPMLNCRKLILNNYKILFFFNDYVNRRGELKLYVSNSDYYKRIKNYIRKIIKNNS